MTWSRADALAHKKKALRLLLDDRDGEFTRSDEWYKQDRSDVPDAVWSLLLQEGFVVGNVVGGAKWRLTIAGWIEACRLWRHEIALDKRFGRLSAHLKALVADRKSTDTTVQEIAANTSLASVWVSDAIEGQMAEKIYKRHGARMVSQMGDVEISSHIGNPLQWP